MSVTFIAKAGTGNDYFLFNLLTLLHRAITALRAISERRFAESFFARAFPPLEAPSFDNATAAGFFFLVFDGCLAMRNTPNVS